ncbi:MULTISPECIES: hypothetical protein [Draconibacterium]|mgnify:CR=1 FL=1|uniref:Uncharacterized protein n=1 Tax=Draconibacterium sediminis TaxID=1544798 RepID=A0A0D8JGB4_9BACT|nr:MULTISPECIES: hypothetical protein [Draconibacterium]KJF44913.1 hypothetical protein LH29_05665 [Draconibacterium sediminis]
MKALAKIIHQTPASYLPTAFPAHYYGMPNGRIYIVFSRFYDLAIGQSGIEFVFAEHDDYTYNYETGEIIPMQNVPRKLKVFSEEVDHPDLKIHIFTTKRNLQSYGQAQAFLNEEAMRMCAVPA